MLSRLLDPRDGKPRDPAFWLVLMAVAAAQLLAFFLLCSHQVRKAEARRAEVLVQSMAQHDCLQYLSGSTIASCSSTFPMGTGRHVDPMVSSAGYALR
jgi:hypothetical protein